MSPTQPLLALTRRHFFRECGVGIGTVALASLLNEGRAAPADPLPDISAIALPTASAMSGAGGVDITI